ncbi:hypothetical protein C8J56DRAFT_1054150 [Mycena floridula]|nr:hypothetical protein C8J56DRAFT_1054150 [Mycena floridula]
MLFCDQTGHAIPTKEETLHGVRWACINGSISDLADNALKFTDEARSKDSREEFSNWENEVLTNFYPRMSPGWGCKNNFFNAFMPVATESEDLKWIVNSWHKSVTHEIDPLTGQFFLEKTYAQKLKDLMIDIDIVMQGLPKSTFFQKEMAMPFHYPLNKLPSSFGDLRELQVEVGSACLAILSCMGWVKWFTRAFPRYKDGVMIDWVMQQEVTNLQLLLENSIGVYFPLTVEVLSHEEYQGILPELFTEYSNACEELCVTTLDLSRLPNFANRWVKVNQYDAFFQPLSYLDASKFAYINTGTMLYIIEVDDYLCLETLQQDPSRDIV